MSLFKLQITYNEMHGGARGGVGEGEIPLPVIDLDKRARISGGHRAIPMGLSSVAIAIDLDESC